MNCQQICKISRKKDSTEVKIFQKVLGGELLFIKTLHTADIHKLGHQYFSKNIFQT